MHKVTTTFQGRRLWRAVIWKKDRRPSSCIRACAQTLIVSVSATVHFSMSFRNFALETFLSTTHIPLLHIPLLPPLHHTQTISMSQPISNMAAQPTLPPQQVPGATAGWTHTQLFGIRDNVLAQLSNRNPVLVIPLDNTMPRSDQAATELADALGQVHSPSSSQSATNQDFSDIFTVIIDPIASIIIIKPDVQGIEARRAAKVARPKNCFVIYRLDKHPLIKALNPDMGNNDICKLIPLPAHSQQLLTSCTAKVTAEMWHKESEAVKDEYKRRAEEEKRVHALLHPDYRYAPRKPSEKKKRMTKNKLAKLAASRRATPVTFPTTTQASQLQQQQQLPQLPAAPAYIEPPMIDDFISLLMTDDLSEHSAYNVSRKHAQKQTLPRVIEQKRQDDLDCSDNMEEFFSFDAADGPISDQFTLNSDAWEATWGTPQQ